MPPANKRKRNNGSDDAQRPSPHRPSNLNLAQQSQTSGPNVRASSRRSSGRGGPRVASQSRPSPSPTTPVNNTPVRPPPSTTMNPPPVPAATSKVPEAPAVVEEDEQPEEEKPAFINTIPFVYEYLTDECIARWKTTGEIETKSKALEFTKSSDDFFSLSAILQEVVRSLMARRLSIQDAGKFVAEILKEDPDGMDLMSMSREFLESFSSLVDPGVPNSLLPTIREFLIATEISPTLIRETLHEDILEKLDFVRDSFKRMGTRHATAMLYKQTTFNLLREDTEGYAKLVAEYHVAAESGTPTSKLVRETFQKVKSLIGAFNIDPGRTLDVTLDVFGDSLIKRYRFFIRYLRASSFWPQPKAVGGVQPDDHGFTTLPWWTSLDCKDGFLTKEQELLMEGLRESRDQTFWPRAKEIGMRAFFELGGRRIMSGSESLSEESDNSLQEEDRKWIETTKTYPPEGNYIAAQLLGFKLRYYTSDIREGSTTLPDNLVWLAALLIHIGFISLRDLWPHLHPRDEDMEAVRLKMTKDKEDRELKKRPGGMNALLMAGALPDDTAPPSRYREVAPKAATVNEPADNKLKLKEEEEPILPEPENQKIPLLKALLLLGALPDALFILGLYPWLMELDADIIKYVNRIINFSLSKVSDSLNPLRDVAGLRDRKLVATEQAGLPRGYIGSKLSASRKSLRWGRLEKADPAMDADYRFYWDEWIDNVPVCRSVDDVFTFCSTFLNIAGVRIGEDTRIVTKLVRIGIQSLTEDASVSNKIRWLDLGKRFIVPAMSFSAANTGLANEVWRLLEKFSLPERYNIYAEWYLGSTSRLPAMRAAFDIARSQTKDVLKRISKTNIREMARALAKVTYSSPGVVFSVTLNQLESYDNLIEVIVDCAKFFTALGYDVLTWSILSALGGAGRNRMQADGMLTSQWLRALSIFAGKTFRRYPLLKPLPILQYVAEQLSKGISEDLEILEQIVASMAGIRSDTKYGDEQVRAMAGGPVLRIQTLETLLDERYAPGNKRTANRLVDCLLPNNLAGRLLISIGKERQLYVYRDHAEHAPLKVLGSNVDKIHDAFIQYLDLLRVNVSFDTYKKIVPDVTVLIKDHEMEPAVAFTICRALIKRQVAEADKAIAEASKAKAAESKEGSAASTPTDKDLIMQDGIPPPPADVTVSTPERNGTKDVEMTEAPLSAPIPTPVRNGDVSSKPVNPVIQELSDRLRPALGPDLESAFGFNFYIRFWSLSLHDLLVPKYETEVRRTKEKIQAIMTDRRDVSMDAVRKRDQEKKRLSQIVENLGKEMKEHVSAFQSTRQYLNKEKDQWLTHSTDSTKTVDAIIQECIFPRAVFSAEDSIYTWRFVLHCHLNGVPGFRTMYFFDKMLREKFLRNVLFQCTAREAENFGQFLSEVLKELNIWRRTQNDYEKSAWGSKKDLTGFCTRVKPDFTPDVRLEYEDFRRLLYKWHSQLFQAVKGCLNSSEYMHVRNAIILLKAVHASFPRVTFQGLQLVQAIKDVSSQDPREDLKLSAFSLLGDLKKREKEWVLPQDFRAGAPDSADKKDNRQNGSQTASTKPLDPKVPEFNPTNATNGSIKPTSSTGEVEDGEIDDATKASRERAAAEKSDNHTTRAIRGTGEKPTSKATTPIPESRSIEVNGAVKPVRDDGSRAGDRTPGLNSRSTPTPSSRRDDRRTNVPLAAPLSQHGLPSRPDGDIPRLSSRSGPPRPGDIRDPRESFRGVHDSPNRTRTPEPPHRGGREPPRDQPQHRDMRDPRDARDLRDPRDIRDPRELREARDSRDMRDPRDPYDPYDRNRPLSRDARPRNEPLPRDRGYDMSQGPDSRGRPGPPLPLQSVAEPAPREPERGQLPLPHPDRERSLRYEDERLSRGARPEPPRQHPDSRSHPENRAYPDHPDNRHGPYDRQPYPPDQRDRREDGIHTTPSGPRSDRPARHDLPPEPSRQHRELFQQPSGGLRGGQGGVEPVHGRLGTPSFATLSAKTPIQDPNYGRLSSNQDVPPPLGPRGRAAPTRGVRVPAGPQPMGSRPQMEVANNVNPIPLSPISRGPSGPSTPANEPTSGDADTTSIHPSRLAAMMQVDTNIAPAQPHQSFAPSGPRQGGRHAGGMYVQSNTAQNPSPTTRNIPSGPAGLGERRDSRVLANLNQHLVQADNRGAPAPRGGRSMSRNFNGPQGGLSGPPSQNTVMSPQASQSQPSTMPPSQTNSQNPGPIPSRQDMAPPDRHARPPPANYPEGPEYPDARSGGSRRREGGRQRSRSPSRRDREEVRVREELPPRGPPTTEQRNERPPPRSGEDHRGDRDRRPVVDANPAPNAPPPPSGRESSRRSTRGAPSGREDREERDSRRDTRGGRTLPTPNDGSFRAPDQAGPPPPPQREEVQGQWNDRNGPRGGGAGPTTRNGERGGSGRDNRERRDESRRDGRDNSGRDSQRKRSRGGVENERDPGGESKRPRRNEG